jgi:hypothetical protein
MANRLDVAQDLLQLAFDILVAFAVVPMARFVRVAAMLMTAMALRGVVAFVVFATAMPVVAMPTGMHPVGVVLLPRMMLAAMVAPLSAGKMTVSAGKLTMMTAALVAMAVVAAAVMRGHLTFAMMTFAMMTFAMMTFAMMVVPTAMVSLAMMAAFVVPGHVPFAVMTFAMVVMPTAMVSLAMLAAFVVPGHVPFGAAVGMLFGTAGVCLRAVLALGRPMQAGGPLPATRVLAVVLTGKILHEGRVQLASLFRADDALDDFPHLTHSLRVHEARAGAAKRSSARAPVPHRVFSIAVAMTIGATISRATISRATISGATISGTTISGTTTTWPALAGWRRGRRIFAVGRAFGRLRISIGRAHFDLPRLLKPRFQTANLNSQPGQFGFQLFHFTRVRVVLAVGRLHGCGLPCTQGRTQRHDAQISQHTHLLG